MRENQDTYHPIKVALQQQDYILAERLAKTRLEEDPLDAQSWTSLGEALMHRGYGDAARMVFERAWLLDPDAMWMPRIQSELSKREAGTERYDIELLLLTKPIRLSAAVIVRNGEETIESCIRSLSNAVDEIVVIDYGSTDRTVEIVSSVPQVKLMQVAWQDSFAQIRNEAHSHLTGDWIIWLEADEQLYPTDARKLKEAASIFNWSEVSVALDLILVQRKNGAMLETSAKSRVYPLRRGLSFEGGVYERLVGGLTESSAMPIISRKIRTRLISIANPAIESDREQTRLKLLQRMLQEQPDSPIWLFHYSQELAQHSRWEEALSYANEAGKRVGEMPDFPHRLELNSLHIRLLMELSRWEEAEQAVLSALLRFPEFPDFSYYLSQIHIRKAEQLYKEAEQSLSRALQGFSSYRGPDPADHDIVDWKSSYMLAELALDSGQLAVADDEYGKLLQLFPEWDELKRRRTAIQEQRSVFMNDRKGETPHG